MEESDVYNGDVGDNDDCGPMEVSDVHTDIYIYTCSVFVTGVCDRCVSHHPLWQCSHTGTDIPYVLWQVHVMPSIVAMWPHRCKYMPNVLIGVCHTIHCGSAATQVHSFPMFCDRGVSSYPLWQCSHTGTLIPNVL